LEMLKNGMYETKFFDPPIKPFGSWRIRKDGKEGFWIWMKKKTFRHSNFYFLGFRALNWTDYICRNI
jgi:hypothetical protein